MWLDCRLLSRATAREAAIWALIRLCGPGTRCGRLGDPWLRSESPVNDSEPMLWLLRDESALITVLKLPAEPWLRFPANTSSAVRAGVLASTLGLRLQVNGRPSRCGRDGRRASSTAPDVFSLEPRLVVRHAETGLSLEETCVGVA